MKKRLITYLPWMPVIIWACAFYISYKQSINIDDTYGNVAQNIEQVTTTDVEITQMNQEIAAIKDRLDLIEMKMIRAKRK